MNHEISNGVRKRIYELEKRIELYEQYKVQLITFVYNLRKQYINREITFEEYLSILTHSLKGRTVQGLLNTYAVLISRSEEEIKSIKQKYEKTTPKKQTTAKLPYIVILLLFFIFSFALYKYGPEITGYTVFTQEVGNKDILNLEFNQSQYYVWNISHPQEINSLMISGKIIGHGTARIYMVYNNKKYLMYEGNNKEQELSFSDVCVETCILPRLNRTDYRLFIELENTKLILNSISYYLIETYDLDVYPKQNVIQFKPKLEQEFELNVLNKEKRSFNAILYVEGNLSSYISLSESLIHFAGESTKKIYYQVSLPQNYSPGTYTGDIIIRYLPQGKFRGETPKTVHTFEVMVPYEDVTASADLEVNKIKDNEVMFVMPLVNLGTKEFTAKALVDIYKDNTKIKSIQSDDVRVLAGSRVELSINFESSYGSYHVTAKIFYGNKTTTIEKDFVLGKDSVIISNVETGLSSSPKEGVGFDVWVKNDLKKELNNAYFELYVYDAYDNFITKVVSDLVTIASQEELKITTTINPQEFIPGTYHFKIIMHYDTDVIERTVTAKITKDSIELIKEKREVKTTYELYLIILAIVLVIMNLSWFAYYLKRKL